jgi:hypothetical protein
MYGNKRNKNRWLLFGLALLMLVAPVPLRANPTISPNAIPQPTRSPNGNPLLSPLPEEQLAPEAPK